jgi:hypothetical protein
MATGTATEVQRNAGQPPVRLTWDVGDGPLRATQYGDPALPTALSRAVNCSADRTLWLPLRGRGLCAGRRLNPLTVFGLVTLSRAPYSPQGRGSAPATSAVTTLHPSVVLRTNIDNFLSIG